MRLSVAAVFVLALTAPATAGVMEQVPAFGSNPGGLAMWRYRPASPASSPALVVVMHGCTQDHTQAAAQGWNTLADAHGFYVVYPEQATGNNPIKCFNWAGEYGDTANLTRGQGENQSIKQMVDRMIADHGIDPDQVYAAGFSAGAAMVPVMLATWPDVFAAGAIAAGIPYRCATTVNGAYACQSLGTHPELHQSASAWGDLVRAAAGAGFTGPWPRVAIFHGTTDAVVSPANQVELIKQWTDVHAADQTPDATAMIGAHTRERYQKGNRVVVESYRIDGMGHAVAMGDDPLMPCAPMGGTYLADEDLCTAARAIDFFGIADLGEDGDPVDPPGDDEPPGDDLPPGDDAGPRDPIACGCRIQGGADGAGVGLLALVVLVSLKRRRRRAA